MRVLLVCPYAWEAPGGVQVHVRELAEQLRMRDHEVLVLAPGDRRASEPWVRIVGRPVRIPYRGTVAPISFSWGSWRRVGDAMRRFDPDLVHAHEPLTPSTSMLAVRASTAPVSSWRTVSTMPGSATLWMRMGSKPARPAQMT